MSDALVKSKEFKYNILVVDDDRAIAELIHKYLSAYNCRVIEAYNGKEAVAVFGLEYFDLVISDVKMPDLNGVELLHRIRAMRADIPVIMMSGFSYIMNADEALEIGVNQFFLKPFTMTQLIAGIKKILNLEIKIQESKKSEEFSPIPIEDFLSGTKLKFDIFIKIGEAKFIKLAYKGDTIDLHKIEAFKSKGINFLYVTEDALNGYIKDNLEIVNRAKGIISVEKRVLLVNSVNSIIFDLVEKSHVIPEIAEYGHEICKQTIQILSEVPSVFDLLDKLKEKSEYEFFHANAVTFFSVLIAGGLQWEQSGTLFKIAMASMFHDIGKRGIDPAIISKKPSDLSEVEEKELEKHVSKGRDVLIDAQTLPSDVISAVYQHHERYNGTGYPNGLRGLFIHPFARVMTIANDYANFVYPNSEKRMTSSDAIKIMRTMKNLEYDKSFLQAFLKIFKDSEVNVDRLD